MPLRLRVFALVVAVAGVAGGLWTLLSRPVELGPVELLVLFALAEIAVSVRPLSMPVGGEIRDVEPDDAILAAAAFLLPAPALTLVVLGGVVAGNLSRRRGVLKSAFNVGLTVGSVAVMAEVIQAVGSPLVLGVTPLSVLGVVLGVMAMSALSFLGVLVAVSLASGRGPLSGGGAKDSGVYVLSVLLGTCTGVLAGVAGVGHAWVTAFGLLLLAAVAVVLIRLVTAVGDRARLDGLLGATRQVHATLGRDEVQAAIVESTGQLLGSTALLTERPPPIGHLSASVGSSGRWLVVRPRHRLDPFTEADQRMLDAMADVGATALDNVGLVETVRHQTLHDSLTGLPNTTLLEDRLEQEIRRYRPITVLVLDVDRFKRVNDAYGSHVGDAVLRELAARLTAAVRPGDTVARRGGDEFVLLLTGTPDVTDRALVMAQIGQALTDPVYVEGRPIHLSAGMGTARYPQDARDAVTLQRAANVAASTAKSEGGDRVVSYADCADTTTRETLQLESELHFAIARGQLWVAYQPQVQLRAAQVTGFEALVRWSHPELGLIGPDRFLPIAERSELMASIDLWVLDAALGQLATWRAEGHDSLTLAVNFSPRALAVPDLVRRIVAAAEAWAVPLSRLVVEITEKVAADSASRALTVLAALRREGVCVAVDDFGTGHSSLSRLRDLPVDHLKIDQSFVRGIGQQSGDEAIVEAAVTMGHRLGLTVVAEGIETEEQLRYLDGIGCDVIQGYLVARPLSAELATDWLRGEGRQIFGWLARALGSR